MYKEHWNNFDAAKSIPTAYKKSTYKTGIHYATMLALGIPATH